MHRRHYTALTLNVNNYLIKIYLYLHIILIKHNQLFNPVVLYQLQIKYSGWFVPSGGIFYPLERTAYFYRSVSGYPGMPVFYSATSQSLLCPFSSLFFLTLQVTGTVSLGPISFTFTSLLRSLSSWCMWFLIAFLIKPNPHRAHCKAVIQPTLVFLPPSWIVPWIQFC